MGLIMANMNRFELNKIYRIPKRGKKGFQKLLEKRPYQCSDIKVFDGEGRLKEIIPVKATTIRKAKNKDLAINFQKELAENPTTYEKLLKRKLNLIAQDNNIKCCFQHLMRFPGFFFILDFYFTKVKVCVEVDGAQHQELKQAQYDLERTRALERRGVKVIRFSNLEVRNDLKRVCKEIEQVVSVRLKSELVEQTKTAAAVIQSTIGNNHNLAS
jgi:very-short-patch-repair endonuclease